MIEYIRGTLAELTPAQAIVEANGIGYALNISLTTFSAIQGKQEVKLFVEEQLVAGGRDDSFTLFGFATKQERELYRLLLTVSGVGGNSARMILSSIQPNEPVQRDCQWRRAAGEGRERYRAEDSPAHHCRSER